jgi:CheY-like chemotaxis protein
VSFSGRFLARKENHCKKDGFDYLAGVVGNITQPMDRLLLIDDEADVQYSFRRIFDSPEIELNTAASGEEGLRLIPKLKPVLVIMDIRMGGLNGLETLRRLRQLDPKLLVIMMTPMEPRKRPSKR